MKKLSVLSLNLRFGLADDGPNAWDYRKESVVKLFKKQSPDFIATQEANNFQIDFLVENLSEYSHIGRRYPAPNFWQDNILFYRKPIVCKDDFHFFLSQTPDIPSRSFGSHYPRQATLGLFQVDGHSLIFINTHLDFETPAQMGAARVIKKQLASYDEKIPTILMGDFNSTPESLCYQRERGRGRRRPRFQ
jgi:endonuclease/exonuclease/phosphatase family metal-dependent hydrolase